MRFYIDELRLSPYTFSVLVALLEKGVPFETVEVGFAANRSLTPAFKGQTFTDLIPALEDGGLLLSESSAILEYLEERFPERRIFPADLGDRARARMLLSWYRCGMKALREERSTETIFHVEKRGQKLPPLSPAARDEVAELLPALLATLKPGAVFLFGGWSIVDTETALMLYRLMANGDPVDPRLAHYAAAIWNRPSSRAFIDAPRKAFRSYYA
jgi:glutathione S-transferase